VYETLRTYNGRPFLFDRHMRRLRNSAGLLHLRVPFTDDEIGERFAQTLAAARLGLGGDEAYIRVLLTRGIGDLSYDPAATPSPSVVVIVKPQVNLPAAAYEQGVVVAIVPVVRNHPGTVNPLIKSNNLLNSALGMQEAIRRGAFEGVMRNYRGELAECTTANIFIVRNQAVLTPPVEAGLLPGITREFLFEIAAGLGLPMREAVLRDDDLLGAEEAFLTSTTREVVPVVRVDDSPIGDGRPGPITVRLLEAFRAEAQELTRTPRRVDTHR
jgi:branched-chain amino acid aminotransferase